MDLVLKPSEVCNFKCTFCSSPTLSNDTKNKLDLKFLKEFLETHEVTTVIINGGDPLALPYEYLEKLIDICLSFNSVQSVSLTTNLWAFYKEPDKWEPILKKDRVNMLTSFQYGDRRLIDEKTVYTEELFWKVSDLCLERLGYRPMFISVLDYDNADTAIQTIELAKRMGVECKINYIFSSGRAKGEVFYLADIFKIYMDIHKNGLSQYEQNGKAILYDKNLICPMSRDCVDSIRVIQPDNKVYSCPAMADDCESEILSDGTPELKLKPELSFLKSECFSCELFKYCNSCHKKISDIRAIENIEMHCSKMKEIKEEFLAIINNNKKEL
jgi:radical SAM protein with 4Fe4S-binding SPASM domain